MFRLSALKRLRGNERGNVAIMFAAAALPICGLIGGAIDYTRATGERSRLQMAMDAAVLAGAAAPAGQQVDVAQQMFSLNLNGGAPGNADNAGPAGQGGQPDGVGALSVSFTPEDDGLHGAATKRMETTLLSLLRIPAIDIQVEAKARAEEEVSGARVCIVLVGQPPQQGYMLMMNGATRIVAPECEIHLSKATAAPLIAGSSHVQATRVCVKGPNRLLAGVSTAPIEVNCDDAVDDTFAGTIQTPSQAAACQHNNFVVNGGGTVFINPGVYCGNTVFNGSGRVQMTPGLYVFRGNVTLNGSKTLEGEDVTLHLASTGQFIVNGSGGLRLKAPRSGTHAGVLMFEPAGHAASTMIFNGSTRQELEGLVYLPSRQLTINGGGTADGSKLTLVLWALTMNGSVQLSIEPDATAVALNGGGAAGVAHLVH